jgi:hypothetical protein
MESDHIRVGFFAPVSVSVLHQSNLAHFNLWVGWRPHRRTATIRQVANWRLENRAKLGIRLIGSVAGLAGLVYLRSLLWGPLRAFVFLIIGLIFVAVVGCWPVRVLSESAAPKISHSHRKFRYKRNFFSRSKTSGSRGVHPHTAVLVKDQKGEQ